MSEDRFCAWQQQAEDDWQTFQVLAGASQHAAACFFAQQAAEKAVKALLVRRHRQPWGHSVWRLIQEAAGGTPSEAPLEAGRRLDFYDIPTRHPDVFPEGSASEHFTAVDVARARADGEEVRRWVFAQLQEDPWASVMRSSLAGRCTTGNGRGGTSPSAAFRNEGSADRAGRG